MSNTLSSKQPVLVFTHLPKTGGSTLDALLLRQFPREKVFHISDTLHCETFLAMSDEEREARKPVSGVIRPIRVRAKVEHQFGIIKRRFGFCKVRYRGLDKNAHRLFVACALSNLVMAKPPLLRRKRLALQVSCA